MDSSRITRLSKSQIVDGHSEIIKIIRTKRANAAPPTEPLDLGKSLRTQRTRRGWTLARAAEETGLARSTLSKIENNQMSPTFEVLQRISRGFQIDIADLFSAEQPKPATGRCSVVRKGAGRRHTTPTHRHEVLHAALSNKRMLPFCSTIRTRSLAAFDDWMHHDGEEFAYVLKGTARLYSEHYEPVDLGPGDSVYLDSTMRHALISTGSTDAVVLWIVAA